MGNYSRLRFAELEALCAARGLSAAGKKINLIAHLTKQDDEDDVDRKATAAAVAHHSTGPSSRSAPQAVGLGSDGYSPSLAFRLSTGDLYEIPPAGGAGDVSNEKGMVYVEKYEDGSTGPEDGTMKKAKANKHRNRRTKREAQATARLGAGNTACGEWGGGEPPGLAHGGAGANGIRKLVYWEYDDNREIKAAVTEVTPIEFDAKPHVTGSKSPNSSPWNCLNRSS